MSDTMRVSRGFYNKAIADEQRIAELEAQRTAVMSLSWRTFPDAHGEGGETWAAAFADLDMIRIELERRIAELERALTETGRLDSERIRGAAEGAVRVAEEKP